MKVRRVLIYEGPEDWVKNTLDRSYVHGPNGVKDFSSHNLAGEEMVRRRITELTCIDITNEEEAPRETPRGQQPMDGEI